MFKCTCFICLCIYHDSMLNSRSYFLSRPLHMISSKTALRWLSHCFFYGDSNTATLGHVRHLDLPPQSSNYLNFELNFEFKLFELWPSLPLTLQSATNEISAVWRETIWKRHIHAEEGEDDSTDVITFHVYKLVTVDFFTTVMHVQEPSFEKNLNTWRTNSFFSSPFFSGVTASVAVA